MPTKAELLEALKTNENDVVRRLSSTPAAALSEGRYENGWDGRQILAHVASMEWTYPRLLELARDSSAGPNAPAPAAPPPETPVRRTTPEEAGGVVTRPMAGGIDAYNARQVEKRADASIEALLAEFQRNRSAT